MRGRRNIRSKPHSARDIMFAAMVVGIPLVMFGQPIPYGYDAYGKARSFVKALVPGKTVSPDEDWAYAAVLLHIIRHGEEDDAIAAMRFAAQHGIGPACPYAIKRLQSGNAEVRASARRLLTSVARADHGESIERWQAWWWNPPRRFLLIGQRTLEYAFPVFILCLGLVLRWKLGKRGDGSSAGHIVGAVCFTALAVLGSRIAYGKDKCAFDGVTIIYWRGQTVVIGLEDVVWGGGGAWRRIWCVALAVATLTVTLAKRLGKNPERADRNGAEGEGHEPD
jgi:hypothetical protein